MELNGQYFSSAVVRSRPGGTDKREVSCSIPLGPTIDIFEVELSGQYFSSAAVRSRPGGTDKREVSGSTPLRPTRVKGMDRGYSSDGRAPGLQPGGHRFDPG